jgi:CPA2 family monovalent cation:H+ antiporter-2
VLVAAGAKSIGRRLLDLNLAEAGVEVTAVRRRNVRTAAPAPDMQIEEGDVIVLLGAESAVAAAEIRLLQG